MRDANSKEKTVAGKAKTIKIVIAFVVIIAIVVASQYFNIQQVFRDVLNWISELGHIGTAIFIGIYVLACVLMLPGTILTLGAGVIFGVIIGSIVVSVASTVGATCAFVAGRYLARDWIAAKIAGNEKFNAVDEAVEQEGWKIVLLTRLSPVFPFNLLNYSLGLTKVRLSHYVLASWIGMIPGTVMYVYIGSLAGDLASLGTVERARTTGEWVLYGVSLLATIAVTIFVTRLARKALADHVALKSNDGK